MPTTYEPIATQTLGGNTTSVTFSSIPQTYTDLRLSITYNLTSTNIGRIRFNSDSGANYSAKYLIAMGSSIYSRSQSSLTYIDFGYELTAPGSSVYTFSLLDIFNYTGSTRKTMIGQMSNDQNSASGSSERNAGIWRDTSAITSIEIGAVNPSVQFRANSTFTLYGIKNA